MENSLIVILMLIVFSGCISNENLEPTNDNINLKIDISNDTNNFSKNSKENDLNINKKVKIPFNVLELGIYGNPYRNYKSEIIENNTVIKIHAGKKFGLDNEIRIDSIYEQDAVLYVIILETTSENYADKRIVYPYEIVIVEGIYRNIEYIKTGKN
ncbi:conserved hypothetical protein [Methanococcus vannielii SB]|jgi:hypothetical protein|uniref:PrcB C-terminal domain-containing protein n=1 Tax=Methanococcus vannielii (strain ATCC 35089 / DSM 1224 / JCM 13029 / OCM 148 / SB) TaxID=406327 RepID=A6UPY9_METVS|nr:hypothetical protein [Methanococcus vannielii]ABR54561.1 conserved hypothetical protein [Methanococcus vannielii SB]